MSLFPESTNGQYRGAAVSAWFLLLSGGLECATGLLHFFRPLEAAVHIAGIVPGQNAALITEFVSWGGSVQLPFGLAMVTVALRYRTLVPLFLLFGLIERAMMSLAGWVLYPSSHHPPFHYASPVTVVLLSIFIVLSLRERA